MSRALEIEGLDAGYGEVRVLHGVSLRADAGGITAVIGSNGAGKTTLLRVLAGLIAPTAGRIRLDGQDITSHPAHRLVSEGVVMVPEGRMVFPDMTVAENLSLGAIPAHARAAAASRREEVMTLFTRLRERERQLAGTLSGGEQQMLALGRGLMAQPRLLLLDEPTLGLAPAVAKQIFRVLPALRDLGLTVLLAEQDVHRTLRIADQASVLENGRIVAEGPGAELAADPAVRRAYLGHD
jgi:branched-chain amino acid transport system ATP-binding protein